MSDLCPVPQTEFLVYPADDGGTRVQVRLQDETVWLTQGTIAELYQTTPQNISMHLKAIYEEGELGEEATCKDFLQVRTEGNRSLKRNLKHYRLEAVLAVGYRVKSPRATQFRQWATAVLKEFLVKGFVMNDERLKEPTWDYFDELLERIRDIRASEKRFYQKVRDLFALSQDYQDDPKMAGVFFAEVQNKLLHAVTGCTAAEIVVQRANPDEPNMGLMSWKGDVVRKSDVVTAKNYLRAEEVEQLNRVVTMFLDYAEDRVSQRKQLSLADWRQYVNQFILFNERPLLGGPGKMSHDAMETIAHKRYADFDQKRRRHAAVEADAEEIKELEAVEKRVAQKLTSGKSQKGK